MSNQRGTFAKRSREMKLKESAKLKADRRMARKTEKKDTKGPPIAWDEAGGTENAPMADDAADAVDAAETNESGDGVAAASPSGSRTGTFDTSDVDR